MSDPRNDGPRPTLDAWLRAAYAAGEAGCPPPEAFLEAEAEGLSPDAQRALDEHAARCPACAAERDLARLFDSAPERAGVRPADLSFVVSRLEETSPARSAAATNVVPFRAPRREETPRSRSVLRVAAAAVLVIGGALGYRAFQPPEPAPPLPEAPEVGGPVRGGTVEALSPVGEVAEIPMELRWVVIQGAATYRVRITAVDGSILWEDTAPAPPAPVPAEVAGRLHRAVLYTWTVEALDPSGARLAASEPVRFRARPAPEGRTPEGL